MGDVGEPDDLLYRAWSVIANVGHKRGGWDAQDAEWVAAATAWRDAWFADRQVADRQVGVQ